MKKETARVSLAALFLSASLYGAAACDDDDTSIIPASMDDGGGEPDAAPQDSSAVPTSDAAPDDAGTKLVPVTITFKAKVGTQEFQCGTTYAAQGSTSTTAEPADLRFFVQDVKLLDAMGTAVPVTLDTRAPCQTPNVALLDFENGTGRCVNGNADLNDKVTGTVPAGTYMGIVFSNGVPEAVNHLDPATAPAPLTAGGMTWGWLLGHLFIKAEMKAGDAGVGLFHLGSVGCTNAVGDGGNDHGKAPTVPCSQPNRNEVRLTGFDPATNVVVLDVGTLFAGTNLDAMSMCHSGGPACPPMFARIGLEFDGGARLSTPPAFRVE